MTARFQHRPLTSYPQQTLAELGSRVAALLRYEDLLPTDLSVKLDLLRDDISAAFRQATQHPHTSAGRPPQRTPLPRRESQ